MSTTHKRRRLVKSELIIYKRNSRLFRSACYPNGSNTSPNQICKDGAQFQIEIRKIRHRGPRSIEDAELGHFTLFAADGKEVYKDL